MKSMTIPLMMRSIISLIMSGMYYYREVYQNIQYIELFYMFFDIMNETKCERSVIMQQCFYNNEYITM